jgi:hypothetical protein
MAVQRTAPEASLTEVLDRVLDRGIVIDAWLRVSVAGIALIDVDARVVVASIRTYLLHTDGLAQASLAARPSMAAADDPPEPRLGPAPRVQLRCEQGCTFIRSARRRPATVRCPADRGHRCPVVPAVPSVSA